MRSLSVLSAVWLAGLANAADIVYVTDLEIYTLLAPCAASALTYDIGLMTYSSRCDENETKLQSCICSNTGVYEDVSTMVEEDVASGCGTAATADVWSASKVIDQYCNPDSTITFSTPTTNIVNAYITDLAQTDYLAPCAQSGLSAAVMGVFSYCPEDASLYAPCVCSKTDVVDRVSSYLSSFVRESCSNGEDVTSARGFYSEYCAMNKGTTSFAVPDGPPGDMTYHITALPQFGALRSCAQAAVSEVVLSQTEWLCPSGPQALASCVCIKSGNFNEISSTLTSSVKWSCDNTATADVTSAVSVLKYYCSAAENKVVAEVTESVSQSYPAATTGSGTGAAAPGETGASTTSKGGSAGGDNGDASGSNNSGSSSDGGSGGGVSQTATIAASVLGGVIGLAIIAVTIWFFRRRNQKKKNAAAAAAAAYGSGQQEGKPELASNPSGTPRPDTAKMAGSPDVSALHPELASPTSPGTPQRPELQGNAAAGYAMPYGQPPQELVSPGSGYQQSPTLNGQPVHEFPGGQVVQNGQQGMGWQSGPVQTYELDSNHGRAI